MLRKLPIVDDVALRAIRCTVRRAIHWGWFRRDEIPDLTHDVVIQLLKKKDHFDPTRSRWSTFCSLIARNYLITEARRRRNCVPVDSINEPREGDTSPISDSVEDRHSTARCHCDIRPEQEWIDLQEDLATLIDRLPDPLREFCENYLQRPAFSDVADSLGVSRNTVYRRRNLVREQIAEDCLEEYKCSGRQR